MLSAFFKNEQNLKRDTSYLKIACKRQKKNIDTIEKKKRKMRKSQTTTINIFLLLLFYVEKFIFS